jgi:DNA topoisomerase-1
LGRVVSKSRAGVGGRNYPNVDDEGNRITDPDILARIHSLPIPPAYTEVRIARHQRANIQAIGKDKAGRWQYRYHPDWTIIGEDRKAARLLDLVSTLPKIRNAVRRDVASRKLDRNMIAACVIAQINRSHSRWRRLNSVPGQRMVICGTRRWSAGRQTSG